MESPGTVVKGTRKPRLDIVTGTQGPGSYWEQKHAAEDKLLYCSLSNKKTVPVRILLCSFFLIVQYSILLKFCD